MEIDEIISENEKINLSNELIKKGNNYIKVFFIILFRMANLKMH